MHFKTNELEEYCQFKRVRTARSDYFLARFLPLLPAQLIRYGLVGVATNSLAYLVYWVLTYGGLEPKKTMSLLYAISALIGFIGNRQWVFAHKDTLLKTGMRYLIAHLCGYTINLYILVIFVDKVGFPHQWIQALAIAVVAIFLFLAFKYFVFPKNESGK